MFARSGLPFAFYCLGACLILHLATTQARAADCTLKRYASLDMMANTSASVAVPATIDGSQLLFLVDTGGVLSGLTAGAVQKLDLKTQSGNGGEYSANGKKNDQIVQVPSFGLGDGRGESFQFIVDRDGSDGGLSGRLSPDILRGFDVDFDFDNKKLNLFSQDHCKGRVVYWSSEYAVLPITLDQGGHIAVRVELDGQTLDAIIDTGSTYSTISEGLADRMFGVSKDSPQIEHPKETTPDSAFQYHYRFKTLAFGGVTVTNPDLYLLPDLIEQTLRNEYGKQAYDPIYGLGKVGPSVIIGLDVLRKLHMYIAYKERNIYVTAAHPPS